MIHNNKHFKNRRAKIMARLRMASMLWPFLLPLIAMAQNGENITGDSATVEKVNVAYGVQDKDQTTAAISAARSEDLYKTQTASLSNTLFGAIPGLAAIHRPGAPGYDEASLYLRGVHTFGNNEILILLDGFQIDSYNQVSVDEIASITVLKDAAAVALYGNQGANGVLLITTKRGRESGKINVNFKARYGYQTPESLPEFAGSYDYARLYNQALINDGFQPLYDEKALEGYRTKEDPYLYPDVNWYDEILQKGSSIQDYSISFDGGGSAAKYFLMLGYVKNDGLYANTDQESSSNINFQRINFRANADIDITPKLTAEIGLGGNLEERKFPPVGTDELWKNMAVYAPNLYPLKTPEGKITGSANFPNNPLGYILERGFQSRHNRNVQATVKLKQKMDFISRGLNAFGTVSYSTVQYSGYDKTRNYAYYEPILTSSSTGADSLYFLRRGVDTDLSVYTGYNYENHRVNFQLGLDHHVESGSHTFDFLAMYHQDLYTAIGSQAPYAFQNLMGRINYGLKGKYFAELAVSYSGKEIYAPGKRFGFFPAVSAGWLVHKESFWNQDGLLNYLKVRGSAGLAGNYRGASRFNYNQYWGTPSGQGYYFGVGQTYYNALVELSKANPNITWEKALIYNGGVETKWFNNKLSLNADVFYENRFDILVNMGNVTPAMSGASSYAMENRGEVVNYGTEIEALYTNSIGQLRYFAGGHLAFSRNKIIESFETPKKEEYSYRKDRPVGQYFGLEAIGYFKDEYDIITNPVQTFSTVRPGDLKYRDQNNDGIIDVNDEVAIGRQSYPEISFAFKGGLAIRGLDLSFLLQGMANRSVYLDGYMFWPFVDNSNISQWAVEGHWTPQTHAQATFPRLTTEPNANNYRPSNFWVRNVNQLRLANVELGFSVPKTALQRFRVENLRVFISGNNLFSWDDLAIDVDSETLSRGYPIMQTYSAGISINF